MDTALIRDIMSISVSLFIGIVHHYLCYKKEGTVIERFVSGIFFPFIFGVLVIPILVLFPSVLYGQENKLLTQINACGLCQHHRKP